MLIFTMPVELPALRWPTLAGLALGIVFGVGLILWCQRQNGVIGW